MSPEDATARGVGATMVDRVGRDIVGELEAHDVVEPLKPWSVNKVRPQLRAEVEGRKAAVQDRYEEVSEGRFKSCRNAPPL